MLACVIGLIGLIAAAEREGMTSCDARECWTATRRLSRQMDAISMRPAPNGEMMRRRLAAVVVIGNCNDIRIGIGGFSAQEKLEVDEYKTLKRSDRATGDC
jgi:hypothetical protein